MKKNHKTVKIGGQLKQVINSNVCTVSPAPAVTSGWVFGEGVGVGLADLHLYLYLLRGSWL